jgi:hypothetical protein
MQRGDRRRSGIQCRQSQKVGNGSAGSRQLQVWRIGNYIHRLIATYDADHLSRVIEFASAGTPGCTCFCSACIAGHLRQFVAGVVDDLILVSLLRMEQLLTAHNVNRNRDDNQQRRQMQENREHRVASVYGSGAALSGERRLRGTQRRAERSVESTPARLPFHQQTGRGRQCYRILAWTVTVEEVVSGGVHAAATFLPVSLTVISN